jgi:hypothetical protein
MNEWHLLCPLLIAVSGWTFVSLVFLSDFCLYLYVSSISHVTLSFSSSYILQTTVYLFAHYSLFISFYIFISLYFLSIHSPVFVVVDVIRNHLSICVHLSLIFIHCCCCYYSFSILLDQLSPFSVLCWFIYLSVGLPHPFPTILANFNNFLLFSPSYLSFLFSPTHSIHL